MSERQPGRGSCGARSSGLPGAPQPAPIRREWQEVGGHRGRLREGLSGEERAPHPARPARLGRAAESPKGWGARQPRPTGSEARGPRGASGLQVQRLRARALPPPAGRPPPGRRLVPSLPAGTPPSRAPGPAEGAAAGPAGLGGAARARPPGRGSPRASTCRGARGAGSPAAAFIAAAAAAAAAAASSFLLRPSPARPGRGALRAALGGARRSGRRAPRRRRRRPRRWCLRRRQRRGPGNFAPLCAPPRRRRAGGAVLVILIPDRGEVPETPHPALLPPHCIHLLTSCLGPGWVRVKNPPSQDDPFPGDFDWSPPPDLGPLQVGEWPPTEPSQIVAEVKRG